MPEHELSATVEFTDDALSKILAVLPPEAPPERVALLPALLRAWAAEDLREHLSREGRAAIAQRRKKLAAVAATARCLLDALQALDAAGRFEAALRTQMRREVRAGKQRRVVRRTDDGHLERIEFPWPADIDGSLHRRDEALQWLADLAGALAESQEKPPPDKRTISYLVVRDLAAIFELVTGQKPTRRNNPYAEGRAYGPFWDFVTGVCRSIDGVRSLDRAMKDVTAFYPQEFSPFIANLQFRHPALYGRFWPDIDRNLPVIPGEIAGDI